MYKKIYTFFGILLFAFTANAQTTILDFESPATSTTFQYFGSNLDGKPTEIIANPNPTGLNKSANVTKFVKPAVSEVWAGAYSNPNPTTLIDLSFTDKIKVKVHMDHIGSLSLKLEEPINGGKNWILKVANTKVNEWEELVFDTSLPAIEEPIAPAKGFTYKKAVFFFDFGTPGTGADVVSYFDDVILDGNVAPLVCQSILDFETAESSTVFKYFGNTLNDTPTEVSTNPNKTGLNTSDKVTKFVKPAVAEIWAGAYSDPNPKVIIDLVNNAKIKVKVHMDHIGNLALKLEGSADGGDNWIIAVPNTKINEWEELEFDANLPSIEGPNKAAKGFTYSRMVLFFDFGTAGNGTDVTYYVDDICQVGSGAPTAKKINFSVDMNKYTANFDKVYLSGTFNDWSGISNPMKDEDGDGIWTAAIDLPVGLYEYKVTLDDWKAQENFLGTEECTVTTDVFTNRKLAVSGDRDVPKFCFNSCYACGEEVTITFKLGMGSVAPSPDGVWLAGGGNFESPGGRYKMKDSDGDKIYEIVVPRKKGFSSFYTFSNGNCPDYSCKEQIKGLPCSNPNNFDDRFLGEVNANSLVASCFGLCSTNAECTTGTSNLIIASDLFEIWGNPTFGQSKVIFKTSTGDKQMQILNAMGKVIQLIKIDSGIESVEIDTQNFPKGIYEVALKSDKKLQSSKLIKL
jgi:hypothetical protein